MQENNGQSWASHPPFVLAKGGIGGSIRRGDFFVDDDRRTIQPIDQHNLQGLQLVNKLVDGVIEGIEGDEPQHRNVKRPVAVAIRASATPPVTLVAS